MVYRTIETSTWTDPVIRKLPANGKLLFLYLITNDHTHVGGIYYLPTQLMSIETGISIKAIDTLLDTLAGVGLIAWDRVSDVVWVKQMFDYQGKGKKMAISVANHLGSLHNCRLIPEFLQFYEHRNIPYRYTIPKKAHQEQEQEQEQEQKQESNTQPKYSEAFEEWWKVYPRKIGKAKAFTAWKAAVGARPAGELLEITERYAKSPAGNAGQFTPHPATWLSQARYEDDPHEWEKERSNGKPKHRTGAGHKHPGDASSEVGVF